MTQRLQERVDGLGLQHPPRIKVRVGPTEPLMHADRTNRVALIVFGLLVLVIGAGGLIASLGVFSKEFSHRTLIDNRASTYIGHNGAWIWPVAAGVCLVIGLLALRWIVALLVSTDRAGDLPIPVPSHEGTTLLQPAALTGALTREVGAYHGVEAAQGAG